MRVVVVLQALPKFQQDYAALLDVAAEHPEIVARALAAMKDAHTPSPMWKVRGRRVKKKPGATRKK